MKKYYFLAAWIIAWIGTSYTLYLSQFMELEPCTFCWFERTCLFPIAIAGTYPLYRGDLSICRYLLPLSIIGSLIALWQTISFAQSSLCTYDGGCEIGGAIFALVGFILISVLLFLGLEKENMV